MPCGNQTVGKILPALELPRHIENLPGSIELQLGQDMAKLTWISISVELLGSLFCLPRQPRQATPVLAYTSRKHGWRTKAGSTTL